jgi:hypothetical protein
LPVSRRTPKKTFEAAAAADVHLIVQLKANQPTLLDNVESACASASPLSNDQTVDEKRRNRHETRAVAVFDASHSVKETEWEPHVAAVVRVVRTVHAFQPDSGLWKTSEETSFYLSNKAVDAKGAAEAIRQHWGIENKQHYVRDVTLCEDASRIRINPGIFARMRSFGYNILRLNQSDTIAQDRYAAAFGGLEKLFSMRY